MVSTLLGQLTTVLGISVSSEVILLRTLTSTPMDLHLILHSLRVSPGGHLLRCLLIHAKFAHSPRQENEPRQVPVPVAE